MLSLCAAALCLTMALAPTALAADFETAPPNAKVCYPTSIVRSDDGTELKKIYDLGPEDDPAGIPRSDFQKDGFQYTLTDLLKQELPENESRQHTETVTLQSKKKDMESVLALLPQEKEFITDDGLIGNLTLRLDTVQVEPAGYGSSTKEVSAKRSYPNLTDLLKQELPENESRQHTEHVSIESAKKDMESVLALLPQEREFITYDGLMGTLTLRLDTVQVEPSGYGSSTKQLSVKRSYPNLAEQDTQYIPKSIEDGGRTLTLTDIQWQTDNTANMDGYAVADRYTAVATYTGSATSSYVTGYTVTAEYTGTVSRIALNRVRYVAIFEGTPIQPTLPVEADAVTPAFRWSYVLIPLGVVAVAGAGIGGALLLKHRKENADEEDAEE